MLTFAGPLPAQHYSIGWYKVSGGGGASSGGQFSVTGTIGQPDSSAAMTGGSFSLVGGFWSLLSVPPASGPAAPVITSIPTGGTVGEEIVITGENFTGATAVTFDGIAASFTVNSPTQITATVPAGATSGQISVTTPGGTAESAASFTVQAPSTGISVTAVTSDNGYPAHQVQWTDSAGLPRTAILVDQNPTTAPYTGYLRRYSYQANGRTRVCTGTENYATGGNLEFSGDGFIQNHTAGGGDFSSGNGAGVPGTTSIALEGADHVIIQYDMPNYEIDGPYYNPVSQTVPTTVQWFFANGRSDPIFSVSQDARQTVANLGADSRSPYGDMAYDGDGVNAFVGGASYGDTYKFVTLAANPEQVTTNSGWDYTQPNTIPYAMQWAQSDGSNPVDAEVGHVATLPILVSDQGMDSQYFNANAMPTNSYYQDNRGLAQPNGPMIADDTWAYQIFAQNPIWPPGGGPIQSKRLTWGANWGRVGGFDEWNDGAPNSGYDITQYSQHSTDPVGNPPAPAYKDLGNRADGMLMAYSVFVVLGTHAGSYLNGAVGQKVTQMENVTRATLTASVGMVATSGPAGVGNASSRTITYTPAGYNPTYSTWEIAAASNAVNATLTPAGDYSLDHPVFVIQGYTSSQLPASLTVGAGLGTPGVDYFATLDTAGQRLWITVNRLVSGPLKLVVNGTGGGGTPAAPTLAVVPSPPESGMFVFQLSGIAGKTYWVQTSTDLFTWMTASTNVLPASSANVTNAVNAAWNHQFWRAVQLP